MPEKSLLNLSRLAHQPLKIKRKTSDFLFKDDADVLICSFCELTKRKIDESYLSRVLKLPIQEINQRLTRLIDARALRYDDSKQRFIRDSGSIDLNPLFKSSSLRRYKSSAVATSARAVENCDFNDSVFLNLTFLGSMANIERHRRENYQFPKQP